MYSTNVSAMNVSMYLKKHYWVKVVRCIYDYSLTIYHNNNRLLVSEDDLHLLNAQLWGAGHCVFIFNYFPERDRLNDLISSNVGPTGSLHGKTVR